MNRDKRRYLRAALMVLLLLLTAGSLAVAISRGIRDRGGQESRNETEESTPCQEETEISPEETAGTDEESSRDETKEGEDSVRETEKHPEAEEETQQEKGLNSRNQACDREEPSPQETPYQPPVLAIASDLHYQSHSITDRGKAYIDFIAGSDGKLIEYLPQLLDAFSDEIINTDVDVLILSGDITMNGEAENHQELSAKLARIQEEGIPVLVIPGNHDINNPNASYYFGDKKTQGQSVTPEEFYQYYRDLGYDQALSRDEASLSYIYELDERYWIMMLDTCQYEPVNLVGGRISEETLLWMEEWLQKAESANVTVIPVGHHNLQPQSSLYTTDCALDNYQEVTELLERFRLPVYISGHLHVQRVKKHRQIPVSEERLGPGARMEAEQTYEREKEAYGIYEIVSNSLSITPCQYGSMSWDEKGNMTYGTKRVDVSAWAANQGFTDQGLLNFEAYSKQYIKKIISRQIENKMDPVSMELMGEMTDLYAELYEAYYAGRIIDEKAVKSSMPWQWWNRILPDSRQMREMRAMIGDSKEDHNYLYLPAS